MSDNCDYTERAKAWVKLENPKAAALQNAYKKMIARISKQGDIDQSDAESCLEFLAESYEQAGGDLDELFALDDAAPNSTPATWDTAPLVSDDVPVQELTAEEKLASFAMLKASIGKKL